jgi:hypothetical protein
MVKNGNLKKFTRLSMIKMSTQIMKSKVLDIKRAQI